MALQSKRTVRVHEIPAKTTKDQYDDFVNHLCTKPKKGSGFRSALASHFKSKSKPKPTLPSLKGEPEVSAEPKEEPKTPSTNNEAEQAAPLLDNRDDVHRLTTNGWIGTTFCLQHGQLVGTISFENEVLKNEAMERHEKDKNSCWNTWTVEDNFKGVTILHEVSDAKFDICAVHGLGGNAIDTWTANSGRMWFRDFLPEHENLKSSRIMTFGYDSDLTDRSTVMELENWAETLLRSLNEVRTGEKAMARIHLTPNCQNIKLSQCGILFLATPHSGATKADWSNFLVATAHTIGGVRPETVKTLQSFNTASVWDTAAFLNLSPCPPFRCFAEGLRMRVKGTNQHIVTQASATLGKDQAFMIMDVDHTRNVIAFITEYLATEDNPSYAFSNLFEIQDPEERKVFLEFSFEGRSIWEAFDTSLKRLELQGNSQSAAKLLQILPFLCPDNGSVDDLLKMDKRWLRDCEDELPDMAMLKAGYTVMSSWLSKLRAVSFYVRIHAVAYRRAQKNGSNWTDLTPMSWSGGKRQ
ncbi:hypothetical protein FOVSG1_000111 [Fusarium oxysporum f. sp. vasinfectum]